MESKKRGRPPKPKTIRVQALLYPDQKERLDFLSGYLPGNPPVAGLLRDAVQDYLDKQFSKPLQKAFTEQQQQDLRIVR